MASSGVEATSKASEIVQKFAKEGRGLPSLVVFDLDYTLWPFYCECLDNQDAPYLFSEAMGVVAALEAAGVPMAIASRTHTPDIARTFLRKLGLEHTFVAMEIYPTVSYKTTHFAAIQKSTGLPYSSMLFFDDEKPNISTVGRLGVTAYLVGFNGVCLKALEEALHKYAQKSD